MYTCIYVSIYIYIYICISLSCQTPQRGNNPSSYEEAMATHKRGNNKSTQSEFWHADTPDSDLTSYRSAQEQCLLSIFSHTTLLCTSCEAFWSTFCASHFVIAAHSLLGRPRLLTYWEATGQRALKSRVRECSSSSWGALATRPKILNCC